MKFQNYCISSDWKEIIPETWVCKLPCEFRKLIVEHTNSILENKEFNILDSTYKVNCHYDDEDCMIDIFKIH